MKENILEELKHNRYAILVILFIASLKFIALPMMDWQDEKVEQLWLLEKRLVKLDSLFENEDLLDEQIAKVNTLLPELESQLYSLEEGEFKLAKQQEIEKQLSSFDLSLKSFGWLSSVELKDKGLTKLSGELAIEGRTERIILFLAELESSNKYIEVEKFNMNLRRPRQGRPGSASVRINVAFYLIPISD